MKMLSAPTTSGPALVRLVALVAVVAATIAPLESTSASVITSGLIGYWAAELEELAAQSEDREVYPFTIEPGVSAGLPAQIDLGPALRRLWSDGRVPAAALEAREFRVLAHERVPSNDGGLGQAWFGALVGRSPLR